MKIHNDIIQDYLDRDLIRMQRHPELDLRILNYSVKTQWERLWDTVTLQCRGLVVDGEGNVVARCLPKFFNMGELPALGIEIPNGSFSVFEKEDGSYLQLFYYQNQWVVSSKGSFTSDHVGWAWDIIKRKYQHVLDSLVANNAYLNHNFIFELIVPQGRIVRDYGQMEDLILLTVINNLTGKELDVFKFDRTHFLDFPLVKKYNGITDYTQLSKMIADDREGFVIKFENFRMKIKGEEYLRLHKMMTNLTSYDIWEAYIQNMPFERFIEPFPDEMFEWISSIWDEIENCVNIKFEEISTEYWRLNRELMVKNISDDKSVALFFQKESKKHFTLLMAYRKGQIDIIFKNLVEKCKPEFKKCWFN